MNRPFLPTNSIVVNRDGQKLFQVHEENRELIDIDLIPKLFLDTLLIIEDKRFFKHPGFDIIATARAFWVNIKNLKIIQGGSTITQQLARNLFLTKKKSFFRKFLEGILALSIEFFKDKKRILEDYLNTIYFGSDVFGIKIATKKFFNKETENINVNEIALLIGMIKSPNRYSMGKNPVLTNDRRIFVLNKMYENKLIDSTSYYYAINENPTFMDHQDDPETSSYISNFLKQELEKEFSNFYPNRSLIVETSIDKELQLCLEESVIENSQDLQDGVGICILDRHSGLTKALVGGIDYKKNQFNSAVNGYLQPGSLLKPFILAVALENGFTIEDTFISRELNIKMDRKHTWHVRNWNNKYYGKITLREALILSDNTVFAQLIQELNLDEIKSLLNKVGIYFSKPTLSLATGAISGGVSPLVLASAFSSFANNGYFTPAKIITKLFDEKSNLIFQTNISKTPVIKENVATTINLILNEVMRYGTGYHPDLIRFSGKTGTTDQGYLLTAYDDKLLASIFIGFKPGFYRSGISYNEKGIKPKKLFAKILEKIKINENKLLEVF